LNHWVRVIHLLYEPGLAEAFLVSSPHAVRLDFRRTNSLLGTVAISVSRFVTVLVPLPVTMHDLSCNTFLSILGVDIRHIVRNLVLQIERLILQNLIW